MLSVAMANELDGISRLLGNIENAVENLSNRFGRLEERMDEADESRDTVRREVAAIANDTRYLKEVLMLNVKPVTDKVKQWENMGMGALAIIGIGGAAFGALVLWVLSHVFPGLRLP